MRTRVTIVMDDGENHRTTTFTTGLPVQTTVETDPDGLDVRLALEALNPDDLTTVNDPSRRAAVNPIEQQMTEDLYEPGVITRLPDGNDVVDTRMLETVLIPERAAARSGTDGRAAERVEAVLRAAGLSDRAWEFDSSIHSWRCEYPERYGRCDCFAELVSELAALVNGGDR